MKVIGIFDGGTATIKHKGQRIDVGVIRFRMQNNEEVPFEINGYYNKFFRKNVLGGLKHLHFLQEEKPKKEIILGEAVNDPGDLPDNNGHVDG